MEILKAFNWPNRAPLKFKTLDPTKRVKKNLEAPQNLKISIKNGEIAPTLKPNWD